VRKWISQAVKYDGEAVEQSGGGAVRLLGYAPSEPVEQCGSDHTCSGAVRQIPER
jgi:hypothetical protein